MPNRPRQFLRRAYFIALCALPATLFFSYYPIISLGSNDSMNFELSLALIALALLDLIAFINLIARGKPSRNLIGISDRRFFLFSIFPFYATISIFWSDNPIRAILTSGIIWLLFFAVFAIIYVSPLLSPPKNLKKALLTTFFAATTFVCLFCFIQSILDLMGVSRSNTLLCAGCTYRSFGFPHPSGFAIEPQFMGNLLLAPTLLALYLLISKREHQPPRDRAFLVALSLLFSTTLFFTFSRGAIYAYSIALLILIIFALKRRYFRPALIIIPAVSFFLCLGLQGLFAAVGPTSETFLSGVTKSIHQLTLGKIDLRGVLEAPEGQGKSEPPIDQAQAESGLLASPDFSDEPFFDGYVAESTDVRLSLNHAALLTWLSAPGHPAFSLKISLKCLAADPCHATVPLTPTSILFGVGLGGAGTALYANSALTNIHSPKEIVQNQPLSLLLELGLVGILLIIFSLLLAFAPQIFPRCFLDGRAALSASALEQKTFWPSPSLPLLLSLIVAYCLTLQFFSGLPNALHIYLLPPLFYYLFQ